MSTFVSCSLCISSSIRPALFLLHRVWLKLQSFHSEVTHVGRMHFFLSLSFFSYCSSITLFFHFLKSQCSFFSHFPRPCLYCSPVLFVFFFKRLQLMEGKKHLFYQSITPHHCCTVCCSSWSPAVHLNRL